MKPKELFGLAVRLLGLVFLYQGLTAMPIVIPMMLTNPAGAFLPGILSAGLPLAIAYWLVSGGGALVRLAYPDASPSTSGSDAVGGALGNKLDA